MFDDIALLRMANAMAAYAARRHALIARNVAHADTPGYRAQDIPPFAEVWRESEGGRAAARPRVLPLAGTLSPNGNGVALEVELLKAAETRASHDLALAVYRSATGLLRASLGR